MKPKQFSKKYSPWENSREQVLEFSQDFIADWNTALEAQLRNCKNEMTLNHMRIVIQQTRDKFDRIATITEGMNPETMEKWWKFFFATEIGPSRDKYCAKDKNRKEAQARRDQEYEQQWNQTFQSRKTHFQKKFFEAYAKDALLFGLLGSLTIPRKELALLELEENATKQDVEKAFRQKAKISHPDTGGSEEAMHLLNQAKAACLSFCR
jgi:hypothetical protein